MINYYFDSILTILKVLEEEPQSTLKIFRQLKKSSDFGSFYRLLEFCLRHKMIYLFKTEKKYGIPTKFYAITDKGKKILRDFKEKEMT